MDPSDPSSKEGPYAAPNVARSRRRAAAGALVGAVLLALIGFSSWGLWERDEGRYADVAQEMLDRGDFVTPRMDGVTFLDKPPLVMWVTAASLAIWGRNETGARFGQFLFSAATLFLVWRIGSRLCGPRRAVIAVVILASSVGYFAGSHLLTLDLGLTFFVTLAMLGYVEGRLATSQARAWYLLSFAAMAGGMLTKGILGVALPLAAIAVHLGLRREWGRLRGIPWFSGTAVFTALCAPWFVVVSMRHPEFIRYFFLHEHFDRLVSDSHRRSGGWYYYLVILAIGLMPWSLLVPSLLRRPLVPGGLRRTLASDPVALLIAWIVPGLLLFSMARSKLPLYALPLYPPSALAMAALLDRRLGDRAWRRRAFLWLATSIGGAAVAAALVLARLKGWNLGVPASALLGLLPIVGAAMALAFLAGHLLLRRGRVLASLAAIATLCMLATYNVLASMGSVNYINATRYFSAILREEMTPADRVFTYRCYLHGLPFYLGARVMLVAYNEDEVKLAREEGHDAQAFADRTTLLRAIAGEDRVFVVLPREDVPRLQKRSGRQLYILGRSDSLDLVTNRLGAQRRRELSDDLQSTPIDYAGARRRAVEMVPGSHVELVEIEKEEGQVRLTLEMDRDGREIEVRFPIVPAGEPVLGPDEDRVREETGVEEHLLRMIPAAESSGRFPPS